ncbi:hypothetical protein HY633_02850 [Candidatus Uhrbacteria bacterium]|nr:hypothetical protein [Candidatus Uhrbacteria bacterium]
MPTATLSSTEETSFREYCSWTFGEVARGIELILQMLAAFGKAAMQPAAATPPGAVPVVTLQVALEFLPAGTAVAAPAPTSGAQSVWTKPAKVPARLQFLHGLGQPKVLEGVRSEANGRKYWAFVFPLVIILESDEERNSAYAFRKDGWDQLEPLLTLSEEDMRQGLASSPEAARLYSLLTMGKTDLYRTKPAGFIRRFRHQGAWQDRMARVIQTGLP